MDNETLNRHWSDASAHYSESIRKELSEEIRSLWESIFETYRPKGDCLHVLDCGCGPGYFSILLSRAGHRVEAIDVSDGMLEVAKKNVAELADPDRVTFTKMDALHTEYDDNTFDMVVSRNVTWMSQSLQDTYAEWLRVLKPGGRMLVFDANWYLHEYNPSMKAQYLKYAREALDAEGLEAFGGYDPTDNSSSLPLEQLPLASVKRPEYDIHILEQLNPQKIIVDVKLPNEVRQGVYRILYQYLPIFMVCAEK